MHPTVAELPYWFCVRATDAGKRFEFYFCKGEKIVHPKSAAYIETVLV